MDKLSYAGKTEIGLVRQTNQDSFLADESLGLWLVADGMGGHRCGDIASQLAVDTIHKAVSQGTKLATAILQAHCAIRDESMDTTNTEDYMGTTIVATKSGNKDYEVAWVGDSRAYLWDRKAATLKQLTKDHSYVQTLFDRGIITQEQMRQHLHKNIITQSLGINPTNELTVDTLQKRWKPNQTLLLCTDGLTDSLTDDEICALLNKNKNASLDELANILCDYSMQGGGKDNITVQLINTPKTNNTIANSLTIGGAAVVLLALTVLIGMQF